MSCSKDSTPVGCVPPAWQPNMCLVVTTKYQCRWQVGAQVNKFEQVSSDGHLMSVSRG